MWVSTVNKFLGEMMRFKCAMLTTFFYYIMIYIVDYFDCCVLPILRHIS